MLATLTRRHGQFDACEDAVQEALISAATQWPADGVPDNPYGWLLTVATRRLTDGWRSDQARRHREATVAALTPVDEHLAPPADEVPGSDDDTLTLLFLCCHPALSPPSQMALTLRAVGGLTTGEIARAFLVSETAMARRITRAKQTVKAAGLTFRPPPEEERAERLSAVLHVLYLIFNEGYTATSGPDLLRADLTTEAIRLTRQACRLLGTDGEAEGLLALMLLTDARRPARTLPDGTLVPMADQDRTQWNQDYVQEGLALVTEALGRSQVGPYQVQAAIAALHAEATSGDDTDWPQVLALYGVLERLAPNPMVTLNRAVALAMAKGPHEGLRLLESLNDDSRMTEHHRLDAVRAHLLEMAGDMEAATACYRLAAERTDSVPERRYLLAQAARLGGEGHAEEDESR
ncbi:sigma factor-like helix-turn-helix DNA-binding protein [Catenulispora yoronensis]|uniref:Sigma factor-like helix-turn-helix DNA-binding protein n=1 Tax=Catenulispora yoronensis TaxID=450799 RepID=A0ABP5GSX4_9ACTN